MGEGESGRGVSATMLHRHQLPARPTSAQLTARRQVVARRLDHARHRHQETGAPIWGLVVADYEQQIADLDAQLQHVRAA